MRVTSTSFVEGDRLPDVIALCVPGADGPVTFGANRNPQLAWDDVPEGTESFALSCVDVSAPSVRDDTNLEDREVPAELARANFYHWLVVNLPSHLRSISEGEFAEGVVSGGRAGPSGLHGSLEGINDYTGWFAGDADMAGEWYGYDGPCPPWNDSIAHEYRFTVYALEVPQLEVGGAFTGTDFDAAIVGHVLAAASISGIYSLNPRLGT